MKSVLDIVMLVGFVFFMIFLIRGFYLQVQERQAKREQEAKEREERRAKKE
jgi:uncharacterized membrane protein YciS (DUF1049 family)